MTGEQRNPCPISEVSFLNVCKLQTFEEAHIDMPSYPVVRYRAESSNRGRGICSNAGQTGQSCCQNCTEPHFRLWCVVALRACIHAVYRVICHLERVATLTGFESVGPRSNLGPVPKTVPSCSHVLGPKHALIVLDYSVERRQTGRQIKQDLSESRPFRVLRQQVAEE